MVPTIVATSSVHPNGTVSPHPMTSTHVVPTTSSVVPTNTTTPPTPTTKPTTIPTTAPYEYGHYYVRSGGINGTICLLAEMDVKMVVPYKSKNYSSNTTSDETASIHVPYPRNDPEINVTGLCEKATSKLVIMWNSARFELWFKRDYHAGNSSNHTNAEDKSKSWEVEELALFINTENNSLFHNPEGNINVSSRNISLKVPKGYTGYRCHADIKYDVSGVMVHLSNVKLQPFEVKNDTYSNSMQDCPQDSKPTKKPKEDNNNIVPIAVGCALAGLVLIVLIAYIIGRRKSQRGYEKV